MSVLVSTSSFAVSRLRLPANSLRASILGALVWAACAACVPPAPTQPIDEASYPWELRSTDRWPRELLWRQRVEARAPGVSSGFDAMLQNRQGALTLIGLTPFGSRAFVLEQRGLDIAFRSYLDREAPFPPRFMLIDIQRAYFPVRPETDMPDGVHELELGGERVTERWAGGRLVQRTFARLDGGKQGAITVDYTDWRDGAPFKVELKNPWFGYTMTVTILEATDL